MENEQGTKRRRSKRSFFDGIGQGPHYAFGLAADADIFTEDQKVKKIRDESERGIELTTTSTSKHSGESE